ncbi:DUF4097 family beta strand repeat-containing protein [Actinomadura rupiterrae]|uniref:DUF4097 family beta strand repeat-containing protein n=1 Tax=Actinomadura rupiterrae TaxID=559627 RepID=UPI0020A34555|nr:DUF4097 family beta strand repeat-containing protein [Actinomadura rupiterrae]MCP2343110.1 hypothetical protein [Actinomadura rupiterrae]
MPTYTTPEPVTAELRLAVATVRVRAADRADTVVTVRPADLNSAANVESANRVEVEYADGHLSVSTTEQATGWRSWLNWPGEIDVVLDLPAGSDLDVRTNAAVRCEGRLGDVRIRTGNGNVRVEEAASCHADTGNGDVWIARTTGPATAVSPYGRIRLGRVGGPAEARSSSGEIAVGEAGGDLKAKTAYGDITVDLALAGVTATTAYGSVRIGEAVRGTVTMETSAGGLDIGIRRGTAAWLDARSLYGGVRTDLVDDASGEPAPGEDVLEVNARTSYGDIHVHRAADLADTPA